MRTDLALAAVDHGLLDATRMHRYLPRTVPRARRTR